MSTLSVNHLCLLWNRVWLLSTWNVTGVPEEVGFLLYLIFISIQVATQAGVVPIDIMGIPKSSVGHAVYTANVGRLVVWRFQAREME